MSSNTANGTSAAKKWWFSKWFADKNSSETVAAALPSQSSAVKKVSLQQLFDESMIPDELKSLTLREVVENGRLEAVGEGSITLMYNAAPIIVGGKFFPLLQLLRAEPIIADTTNVTMLWGSCGMLQECYSWTEWLSEAVDGDFGFADHGHICRVCYYGFSSKQL